MSKVKEFKKKISETELNQLKEILTVQSRIKVHIGDLEIRKMDAFKAMDESEMKLATLRKSLQETYGDVDINPADGSIIEKKSKK
jgi:hypothetical protein